MLLFDEKEKNIDATAGSVVVEDNLEKSNPSQEANLAKETKEITRSPKEQSAKTENDSNKTKKPMNRQRPKNDKQQVEFEDKIIDIARVTTVVKGGRRFSFSAVVAIGNRKGKVGIGHGKANEVPDAIKKAFKNAKNNLIEVPIVNKSTIPHEVKAKYLASQILIKPAPKGKGIVASGTVRSVVELAGYTDIYTKSYGSRTKQNSAKVVIKALQQLRTVEKLSSLRDVSVEHILKK